MLIRLSIRRAVLLRILRRKEDRSPNEGPEYVSTYTTLALDTFSSMNPEGLSRKELIKQNDEALLASLGYKQEFKRAFTPLEVCISSQYLWPASPCIYHLQVFGIAFSIIGLLPSISSVLFYTVNDGGGPSMVWGVGVIMD